MAHDPPAPAARPARDDRSPDRPSLAIGPATARSYDPAGRPVAVAIGLGGRLRAPVVPGGFTVATR